MGSFITLSYVNYRYVLNHTGIYKGRKQLHFLFEMAAKNSQISLGSLAFCLFVCLPLSLSQDMCVCVCVCVCVVCRNGVSRVNFSKYTQNGASILTHTLTNVKQTAFNQM